MGNSVRAKLKTVNLEAGMPTSDQAVRRLTYEINQSKMMGYTALKLIHGYGSSGVGGRIRTEVRQYLERQLRLKKIKMYEFGENFSIFSANTRAALSACPELRNDSDLERHNNGVTFVIL
jgi:hypothetical protein